MDINELRDAKAHNDKETLSKLWNDGLEVNEIAKLLHISVKLVHIKLKEYEIVQYGCLWDNLFSCSWSYMGDLVKMIKKIGFVLIATLASLLWMTIFYNFINFLFL